MSIIIFSRPIHSGKTTALRQWCNQQKHIYGILMPDINGSRKILNLQTNDIFDIECIDTASPNEHLTSIGKFHFYTAAFEKANLIISNALACEPRWLIIDEAGRLELEGRGFYNSIVNAVEFYSGNTERGKLILTVRDSLCTEVIELFKLKNYKVIHQLSDVEQ